MTIDEAIKHAEEVAEEKEKLCNTYESFKDYGNPKSSITSGYKECMSCAKNHRQLAEWLKELKQLREQTRWIPVSERLPEESADVICSTDAEEVFVASYLGKLDDGSECFDDNNGMMCEGEVIAWMPLPSSYQGE